jgi:hypothetical protein
MTDVDATDAIADATRRALDELAEHPNGQLRAVVVLLDVTLHTDDDDSCTDIIWKSNTGISSAHAYGVCSLAAQGIATNFTHADD